MGSNYKAALIPQRIREVMHGWGKATRRKKRHGLLTDESTIRTETSTICSIEEDDQLLDEEPHNTRTTNGTNPLSVEMIEIPPNPCLHEMHFPNHSSSRVGTPLLRSVSTVSPSIVMAMLGSEVSRSSSMPRLWYFMLDIMEDQNSQRMRYIYVKV